MKIISIFISLALGIFVQEVKLLNECRFYLLFQDSFLYSTFLDLEEIEAELNKLVDPQQNPNAEQFSFSLDKFEFFTAERREIPVVVIEPVGQETSASVVVVCGADGSDFGAVTACLNVAKGTVFF